ncbi:MAG: hypothetical protein QOJ82_1175 [Solirubrobacteraceae bacterium]|nr:hypothetical protein [Solirubrobacteraceae bacterium]
MRPDENTTATGPLRFPAPPDAATARPITERLRGHTTVPGWLPAGVFDWLDELATSTCACAARSPPTSKR